MAWYRWKGEDLELALRVQPRASRNAFIEPDPDGEYYRVRIQAPPVEGKGNAALCRFVAKAFGVAPSRVTLIGGDHARYKRLRIESPKQLPLPIERP